MSKFSTDAGFLTIVEVGQYFLTKDTEEFSQFTESVACHKYTLPRDENHLTRKVGSEGTPRLGPYWKLQPVAYKVNMERKSELSFLNKDSSHSWVRIYHGLNKLVTNLNNKDQDENEQETSEMQFEDCVQVILQADQRPKQNHKDAILPAHPQELSLLEKELGLILNHKNSRSPIIQCRRNWSIFFVMVVYLEKMMERLNSGE